VSLPRFDDGCIDYHEKTKDTPPRRVPPVRPTVDVSKHAHNVSDDSPTLTHRPSMHFDAHSIDLTENTENTSVRRASTTLPTTDASKCVYRLPTSLDEVTDQSTTRFDVPSNTGHQENDKDTSSRRVPLSFLPLAAGHRITTSATCPLAVDVSRRVCDPSVDAHEPTRQRTTSYVVSSGVDYHPDHTELEETSIRRSSPYQASLAYRHSVTTPVTPTVLTVDASNHAHNPSVGFYELT